MDQIPRMALGRRPRIRAPAEARTQVSPTQLAQFVQMVKCPENGRRQEMEDLVGRLLELTRDSRIESRDERAKDEVGRLVGLLSNIGC